MWRGPGLPPSKVGNADPEDWSRPARAVQGRGRSMRSAEGARDLGGAAGTDKLGTEFTPASQAAPVGAWPAAPRAWAIVG